MSNNNNNNNLVLIFDFDHTIIDVDSDYWVVEELGVTHLFNELLPTMPGLNTLMVRMMKELHARGYTMKDIAEVQKRVPIHPRIVSAIKAAHALGCDLRIISDANTFFIETILNHNGLRDCFSEINTNPSFVDQQGRLTILPYHDFDELSPHGCDLCPPNMCKGQIIERIQGTVGEKRLVYIGDGSGDFCPSLQLKHGDFVMPRKDFPVWDLISKNRVLMKAEIHEWRDGEELERVLLRLISSSNAVTIEEQSKAHDEAGDDDDMLASSVDDHCKLLQTNAILPLLKINV